jgi:hypothetical protein
VIQGARSILGIATGIGKIYDSTLESTSFSSGWRFVRCALNGTVTITSTGENYFDSCFGLIGAKLDAGAAVGPSSIEFTHAAGEITVLNLKAGDSFVYGGTGRVILDSTCTAGTVWLRGNVTLVNNGSGMTINQDSRYSIDRILSDKIAFAGADIPIIKTSTAGLAGAAMRGTDSALLAASAPANFGDLAITVTTGLVTVGTNNDKTGYSVTGTVDANLTEILGTTLTEVNTLANNFSAFWDVTPTTTNTVDDVGAGSFWGTSEQNQIRQALGVTGTVSTTSGTGHVDTILNKIGAITSGNILVDHNYGGTDNLTAQTAAGAGIDEVLIQAFLSSDYATGNRSAAFVRGSTRTDVNGRWLTPFALDAETYTLVYFKQGTYGPNTVNVTVT